MKSVGKALDSTECVGVQGSIFAKFEKNGFSENVNRSKVIKMHTRNKANILCNKCRERNFCDRNKHNLCNYIGANCVHRR